MKLDVKATAELLLILACVSIASGVTTLTFNPPYAPVGGITYANCSTTDIDSIANVRTIKFKLNGQEKYRVDLDCSKGNMIEVIDSGMSGRMSYVDELTSFRWDRLEMVDSGQLYSCEVRHCVSALLYASGNAELIVITPPTGVSISPDVINAEEAKPLSTTITCTANVGGPSGALRLLLNNTVDLKMETTTDDGGVTRGSYLATQTFARENVGSTYTCEAYNQLDPRISIKANAIVSVSYPPRQFSVTAPGTPFVVNSSSTGHFVKIKGGSTGKVICAVDSSPSVQVKAESATDLTGIANLKSAAGSATIEILKYTNGKDFSVTCSTAGTTVISTTIQFSISRETTDPGNTEPIVIAPPTRVSISPDVINAEEAVPLSTMIRCTADVGGPSGALRLLFNNTIDLKMETTIGQDGITRGYYLATETFMRTSARSTYTCEAYNQLDPRLSLKSSAVVKVSFQPSRNQQSHKRANKSRPSRSMGVIAEDNDMK